MSDSYIQTARFVAPPTDEKEPSGAVGRPVERSLVLVVPSIMRSEPLRTSATARRSGIPSSRARGTPVLVTWSDLGSAGSVVRLLPHRGSPNFVSEQPSTLDHLELCCGDEQVGASTSFHDGSTYRCVGGRDGLLPGRLMTSWRPGGDRYGDRGRRSGGGRSDRPRTPRCRCCQS
jgi:hypothetical protein